MASKRVATSAVDWLKFAELVPKNQKDAFRAFKAKSDSLIARVHKNSEALPAIDWSMYKARLANPALVDQFQQQYAKVAVNYPKDPNNVKAQIDADEKAAQAVMTTEVAAANGAIANYKGVLAKIDSVPPLNEMTVEMYYEYFPDQALDPVNKPSFWPHSKATQPGFDKAHEIN